MKNFMIYFFISLWLKHVSVGGYQIEPHLEENSGTAGYCFVGSRYKSFDSTIEFCCEGRSKSKVAVEKTCCTKVLDDSTITRCCNGRNKSLSNLKTAMCCGNFLFNKDIEFCYNGTVYPSNEGPSPISNTPTATAEFETNHSEETVYEGFVNTLIACCGITISIWLCISYICCATRMSSRCKNTYSNMPIGSTVSNFSHKPNAENSKELTLLNDNEMFLEQNLIVSYNSEKGDSRRSTMYALPKTNNLKNDVMLLGNDEGTQTETDKTNNVTNVMGRKFDRRHVFDKKNTRLELPNSAVSLTISEDDIAAGPVECYASTYRNMKEIYETFGKYMTECEGIVSPTIEYFFPRNKRLWGFAYVDMKYYKCGCDGVLRVWRFNCEKETELLRVSVPNKNDINPKHERVDAYYEILDPGSIRIYLKSFCTLMCTVCHGHHESFNLAAYMYVVPMPNDAVRHVRVSVYILDGVAQLQDYSQFCSADEERIRPLKKKIILPMRVALEDDLSIGLTLWPESRQVWQQLEDTAYPRNECIVQLHNITECHIHRSNTLPYSSDWHFFGVGNPNILVSNKLIFNCSINIAIVRPHPGVDTRLPPLNKFVLTQEVEFPTTKKTFQGDWNHLRGPIQQPANNTGHWNHRHGPIQQPAISTSTAAGGNDDLLPIPGVSSNHQGNATNLAAQPIIRTSAASTAAGGNGNALSSVSSNNLGARHKQNNHNKKGIEGQNRNPERTVLPLQPRQEITRPSVTPECSGDEDVRAGLEQL